MSTQTNAPSAPRFAIGIECSNPSAGAPSAVALSELTDDGFEHAASTPLVGSGRGSDALVETIAAITSEHGVRPKSVERVCVSVGPGGYTALRVSVTAAKSAAYALGCALYGVPTHDALGARLDQARGTTMTLLASKGDTAHACVHKRGNPPLVLGVVGAPALKSHAPAVLVCDEHAPEPFLELAQKLGIRVERPVFDPAACIEVSASLAPSDPMTLGVFYAREPDAVTQWRLRHSEDD